MSVSSLALHEGLSMPFHKGKFEHFKIIPAQNRVMDMMLHVRE